jgi:hypothetical protein
MLNTFNGAMWRKGIFLSCVFFLAGNGPISSAFAETVVARCKVDRIIDMSTTPNKVEKRSDSWRANPDLDWVFAYDLSLGRLCQVDNSGICMLTSEDFNKTPDGKLAGATKAFSSETSGNLIISPDSGRWIFQSGLTQSAGKAGDCTFAAASAQETALVTRNPALDIDVLCAGRLMVDASIYEARSNDTSGGEAWRASQLENAQNLMQIANTLMSRTTNRGYGRDEAQLAAVTEAQAFAQRPESERATGSAACEAHIVALQR